LKKFIFTAIAMVAFSGISMAGNLEEKWGEKWENAKPALTFCQIVGIQAANQVFMTTGDTQAADRAGFVAQLSCQFGTNFML
jgi:hypothetical protein